MFNQRYKNNIFIYNVSYTNRDKDKGEGKTSLSVLFLYQNYANCDWLI